MAPLYAHPQHPINMKHEEILEKLLSCTIPGRQCPFFLFAGAGSGKTYTLIALLEQILTARENTLRRNRQKIAVITYTNAAVDVINRRLKNNDVVQVSTLHSFLWSLIAPYQRDIKKTLQILTLEKRDDLITGTKRWTDSRIEKRRILDEKLSEIEKQVHFSYSPDGSSCDRGALQHDDVIAIGSELLSSKKLLQRIMKEQYPILLIDESQDTDKRLIKALECSLCKAETNFTLGLIGDIKQRIYMSGDEKIGDFAMRNNCLTEHLPTNYRCPARIVRLANCIAREIDGQGEQQPRENAAEGLVRFYIVPATNDTNRPQLETRVKQEMSVCTQDEKWQTGPVQTLVLEHRMAASRTGCMNIYDALCSAPSYKQHLISDEIHEVDFFFREVCPLIGDSPLPAWEKKRHLQHYSPLFHQNSGTWDWSCIQRAIKSACKELELCSTRHKRGGTESSIYDVLCIIRQHQLLTIPPVISAAMKLREQKQEASDTDDTMEQGNEISAWQKALDAPISEVLNLKSYLTNDTGYSTHQGIKGDEFERVLVLLDDGAMRGRSFSYDKALGIQELSQADSKNISEGKDNTISRTLRLLYVTCTRAKKSLALICYCNNPAGLKAQLLSKQYFTEDEIVIMP